MTIENFTTYTEVDPNSRITKTATRVTATNLTRNEDAYVYVDEGVDHFNSDFAHYITVQAQASAANGGLLFEALTNIIDDFNGIINAGGYALGLEYYHDYTTNEHRLFLEEVFGGSTAGSSIYLMTLNTTYYLRFFRNESVGTYGTLYCLVYSDVARTNLLETLSVALHVKTDFRYLFVIQSRNMSNPSDGASGYSENLDLLAGTTSAPSATTQAVSSIMQTTATGNGNITSLGNPASTQYGHCWATFANPTTTDSKSQLGIPTSTGAYTSSFTNLIPNTLYYCRTYITSNLGTFYGAEVTFITLGDVPVVTTEGVYHIFSTTAECLASIDNNGGSSVTQHGSCWSTSANPTTADSKTTDGPRNVGGFFSVMTGLTANTLYHVRPYATNGSGTGYGADVSFFTMIVGAPSVTTEKPTDSFPTTAIGHGTIVNIGESAITQYGVCWDITAYPTVTDSGSGKWGKTTEGAYSDTPPTAFASLITGLTAGTAYHCRAYATNSYGTGYGNDVDINPLPAGEQKGNFTVLDIALSYTDKYGQKRYLVGVPYG